MPTSNFTGFASYNPPAILPHTSYTPSCTMNSLNQTSMLLKQYIASNTTASFVIHNPGPLDDYEIAGLSLNLGSSWRSCESAVKLSSWQILSCEYLIDQANSIALRLAWACDDRDPYHPVLFNATVIGALTQGAQLSISNLSWTGANHPMDRGPSLPWI